MVYRVELSPKATFQVWGLPKDVYETFMDAMVTIATEPRDLTFTDPTPYANVRRIMFGDGRGLVTYVINDDDQVVFLDDVFWIG